MKRSSAEIVEISVPDSGQGISQRLLPVRLRSLPAGRQQRDARAQRTGARDRILAAGFAEQLAKPIDAITMLQSVRRALPASADLA